MVVDRVEVVLDTVVDVLVMTVVLVGFIARSVTNLDMMPPFVIIGTQTRFRHRAPRSTQECVNQEFIWLCKSIYSDRMMMQRPSYPSYFGYANPRTPPPRPSNPQALLL